MSAGKRVPPYALDKPGERVLLHGNQAIARGFLEGGGQVASTYPGTPASEILETIAGFAEMYDIYAEWASNEMVGFEVAAGAALCGARALSSMKHIGVNWAMDPLMHLILRSPPGGFILVSGDDPSQHSSANEQDNRYIARIACIPCFEPSSPAEAKEMTAKLFDISESIRLPVMLRPTTRVCHARSDVVLGPINRERRTGTIPADVNFKTSSWTNPAFSHKHLHDKELKMKEIVETVPWNWIEGDGSERLGVLGSGLSYNYAKEAIGKLGLSGKVSLMKLATTYPTPDKMLTKFMSGLEKLLVVEELEPFVELYVRALAKEVNPKLAIYGKMDFNAKMIPREEELNTAIVGNAVADFAGVPRIEFPSAPEEVRASVKGILTPRGLDMCAGCPHRATGYAMKTALRKLGIKDFIGVGDIGCYGMVSNPPLQLLDTELCMGASIGTSQGCARVAKGVPVFGIIGDSTFLHAGIPGLVSAIWNNNNVKFVICDNEATAMTGFQPHPGTGRTAMGRGTKVDIESVVRGVGVKFVEVIDPYDVTKSVDTFMKAIQFDGPACIISRRICASEAVRLARRAGKTLPPHKVDLEKCPGCRACINLFGCPALVYYKDENKVKIDNTICIGCGVCAQICPYKAISPSGVA